MSGEDKFTAAPGDEVIVFDADAWNGEDVGDNSQFYRRATILSVAGLTDPWASVRFRDGRVSHGHIISHMRPVEPST